jgi:D-alanine transaminase
MADPLVYLNGRFVQYAEAMIPVEDRAMQFGDGIYEVVRYYNGRSFLMDRHMDRLARSAIGIELSIPPIEEITAAMDELVRRQNLTDAAVYVQITRGSGPRTHGLPSSPMDPTVIVIARPSPVKRPRPTVTVVTASDDRWAKPYLKTTMLLPNALARARAARLGADDALFVRDGFVIEATSSNVFAVFNGTVTTPPLSNYLLAGITRGILLEVCPGAGVPFREELIPLHTIYQADEVFLTGTNNELLPVVSIDGRPVGAGQPGPVFSRVLSIFDDAIERNKQS